jgi:hypothetical protein
MLINVPITSAKPDLDRRWIADDYFDLVVWYESDQKIHGFQLCYDKPGCECALTWTRERGFVHTAIDSGESTPTSNRTPILVEAGTFPFELVRNEFISRSQLLPVEIRELVLTGIQKYEGHKHA